MMGKKSIIILIIFDTSEKTSENKNSSRNSSNHYCQSLTVHGLLWNQHFVPRGMNYT